MSDKQTTKNHYSNADSGFNSYDHMFSSLSWGFFNSIARMKLAPIKEEFIGKQAKKGDRVYDYDNEVAIYFAAGTAELLLNAIQQLKENEEYSSVEVVFGEKRIEIFRPGKTLKVRGKSVKIDGYLLKITTVEDEEEIKVYHILQSQTMNATTEDGEEIEITVDVGLNMMIHFLNELIRMASGSYRQGTLLATPSNSSKKTSAKDKKRHFAIDEDDDEDDDEADDDDEDDVKPSKKKASKKTLQEMEDEFNDDEDED